MEQNQPKISVLGDRSYLTELVSYLSPFFSVSRYSIINKLPVGLFVNLPDLIIIDEAVAIGSITLTSMLKQHRTFAKIPVILVYNLSSRDISSDEEHRIFSNATKAGAVEILLRPFGPLTLSKVTAFFTGTDTDNSLGLLPKEQAYALKKSVTTFKNVFQAFQKSNTFKYAEIRDACLPIVNLMSNSNYGAVLESIKEFDGTTFAHSIRVASLLTLFGSNIGLVSQSEQVSLCSGGIMHDFGKVKLPLALINKTTPLTPSEYEILKTHVALGLQALKESGNEVPQTTRIIVEQHHCRVDNGEGSYPRIPINKLHPLGRMAAIVDSFAALTDTRSYRPAVNNEQALRIMFEDEGHYDYHLLKEFRDIVRDVLS